MVYKYVAIARMETDAGIEANEIRNGGSGSQLRLNGHQSAAQTMNY